LEDNNIVAIPESSEFASAEPAPAAPRDEQEILHKPKREVNSERSWNQGHHGFELGGVALAAALSCQCLRLFSQEFPEFMTTDIYEAPVRRNMVKQATDWN